MKTCSHCHKEKPLDLFRRDKSRHDGKFTWCKPCEKEWTKENRKPKWMGILGNMQARARKRGFVVEWTQNEIERIVVGGKCELTGIPFDNDWSEEYVMNPFSASPDRIDSNKGYTKENTRWVCWWVNQAFGQYPDHINQKFIRSLFWRLDPDAAPNVFDCDFSTQNSADQCSHSDTPVKARRSLY